MWTEFWHGVVDALKANAWIIASYGALLATWSAWVSWRRDVSRFSIRLRRPPSYKPDEGLQVVVTYRGGPPIPIKSAQARVVRIEGIRWFEAVASPPGGNNPVLKPEAREITIRLDSQFLEHFWYVDVAAEDGTRRRKWFRPVPKFWLKEKELGILTLQDVGAVATPGELEKSLRAVVNEAKKAAKAKKP